MRRTLDSFAASSNEPRTLAHLALLHVALLIAAASSSGCRPAPSSFYDKVYFCDKTIAGAQCGTNAQGQPMSCFPARQLGALDFCADACDGDVVSSSDEAHMCLESKSELKRCRPSADATSGGGDCPEPLHCYRTDLLADEGVCTTFDVCSPSAPCADPARTTCAAGVLHAIYPHAPLQLNNLYCAQLSCKHDLAACSPGEVCLPNVLPASSRPFDICVPKCDGDLHCPPNFFCLQKASSPSNPAVCLPGLLSFRCVTNNDCMLGECIPTGEGFNVCAVRCEDDSTCKPLSGPRAALKCVAPDPARSAKYCMAPEAFGGTGCGKTSECRPDEICSTFSPYGTVSDLGSCLMRCNADGTCRARGGIPHTCYKSEGLCYPGEFGLLCQRDEDCFGGNKCLSSNPDPTQPAARRCTKSCKSDAECTGDAVASTSDGWCFQGDQTCVQGQQAGYPCTHDNQCASGVCAPTAPPDAGPSSSPDGGGDAVAPVPGRCTARPGATL
jgi:hypothetical protein